MNEILEQIVARSKGPDWGNILFIVFLAIFWVIGGILKAKKSAQEKRTGGQSLGQKPGIKPGIGKKEAPKGPFQQIRAAVVAELEKQRELQKQAQQAKRKMVRPKPAARRIAARPAMQRVATKPGRATGIPTLEESMEETRLPSAIAKVEPKLEKLPEYTGKTVKSVGTKGTGAAAKVPQRRQLSEILTDYSDPDELRRAILHYEILGKPISLRDPTGHIIGL
jgi:sulfite reductase alpha subunit-like flavoprotein